MHEAPRLDPEAEAAKVLKRHQIHNVPVPVERIAKAEGAIVRFSPLDKELSGMIYIDNDHPIIGVNALHNPYRQRFTIAHEIGHLVLHRAHLSGKVHVDKDFPVSLPQLKRDGKAALGTERIEIDANQFAACLLIPRYFLDEVLGKRRYDIDDESAIEDWSKKLRVSKQTLNFRIRNLNRAT